MVPRSLLVAIAAFFCLTTSLLAQATPNGSEQPVRVSVTVNPDGTRTSYQFDPAHRQATATTTTPDGKVTGTIKYEIDDAGRFSSGIVMSPDNKFQYKCTYKYTPDGRMDQETHLNRDDTIINKIVYSYDANGRQTGYVVFDAAGKIIAKTTPALAKPSPAEKRKKVK
jgi:hypothetical protein